MEVALTIQDSPMSDSADLTNALWGFGGVFLGVLFTYGKARNDQARAVREHVNRFRHAMGWYLRLVGAIRKSVEEDPEPHPALGNGEMSRRFSAALESGHALIGVCPDGEVSAKAGQILQSLEKYSNGHKSVWDSKANGPWPPRETIDQELAVLHHMVTPRWWELHLRFRRASTAAKRAAHPRHQ